MNKLVGSVAFGQRTKKKYTYFAGLAQTEIDYLKNTVTSYYYDMQGRLVMEDRVCTYGDGETTQKVMYFLYEESDVVGFIYFNSSSADVYYYDKNPRGDVVGILDSTGTVVVKYKYDAFGNCTRYDTANSEVADANPIRYRSYYYDVETGLYYLEARYYNPAWRRFISPDASQYLDPDSVNGLNLYAYCGNDPINNYDPSGHFAISALIIGAIIGAAIGFGGTVLADYVDDGQIFNGSISAGGYIANTLVGGLIGGLTGGIASSSFAFTYPTLQFAQMVGANELTFGAVSAGMGTATISGTSVATALGVTGITVMGIRIGKSGGYRVDHHYPNDHDPTHVHISGDDGMTRVDINGNPIQGDRPMTPGEKKAFRRLIKKITEALKPWM